MGSVKGHSHEIVEGTLPEPLVLYVLSLSVKIEQPDTLTPILAMVIDSLTGSVKGTGSLDRLKEHSQNT